MSVSSSRLRPTGLLISFLLSGAIATSEEQNVAIPKSPASPTVDAPLWERLRSGYSAQGVKDPREVQESVLEGFGKERVKSRDRFMAQLSKWAGGAPKGAVYSLLVVEVVEDRLLPSRGNYKRFILSSTSDKGFKELSKLGNEPPVRLIPPAWKLVEPYVSRATEVEIVGKYPVNFDGGFTVVLLSFFDGKQWRTSEYRDYTWSAGDRGFFTDEKKRRLPQLEGVLSYGLGIEFGLLFLMLPDEGAGGWDEVGDLLKRIQAEGSPEKARKRGK